MTNKGEIKINWKKVTYYEIIGDGIITRLEVSKVPMVVWHLIRKIANGFDKLGSATRELLFYCTKTEIDINGAFKLPKDFNKFKSLKIKKIERR